jgi:hypothetical protein
LRLITKLGVIAAQKLGLIGYKCLRETTRPIVTTESGAAWQAIPVAIIITFRCAGSIAEGLFMRCDGNSAENHTKRLPDSDKHMPGFL